MAPIIDAEIIQGLRHDDAVRDDDSFQNDLMTFLRDGEHRIGVISLAASRPDLEMLDFAARSLRQSAERMGAMALVDHCRAIEAAATAGDASLAQQLGSEVSERYEAARSALVEYLRGVRLPS